MTKATFAILNYKLIMMIIPVILAQDNTPDERLKNRIKKNKITINESFEKRL
jgi:hypothetical protein